MEIGTDGSFGVGVAYLQIFSKSQVHLLEKVGSGDVPDGGTGLGAEHGVYVLSAQPACTPGATLAAKMEPVAESLSVPVIQFCLCFLC